MGIFEKEAINLETSSKYKVKSYLANKVKSCLICGCKNLNMGTIDRIDMYGYGFNDKDEFSYVSGSNFYITLTCPECSHNLFFDLNVILQK